MRSVFYSLVFLGLSLVFLPTLSAKEIQCEGEYPGHLQGFASDGEFIFWSFTTWLVQTDLDGKIVKKIPVPTHYGDCCVVDGKLYVSVALGWPAKEVTHWTFVHDCKTLELLEKIPMEQGGDGITFHDGFFYIAQKPATQTPDENIVRKMTRDFKVVERFIVPGKTNYGIQAFAWANGSFWAGRYSSERTAQCSPDFKVQTSQPIDVSTGVYEIPPTENGEPRIMVGVNRRDPETKMNTGAARPAVLRDGKLVWE